LSTFHIRFFSHLKPRSKFLGSFGLRVHTLILREFTFIFVDSERRISVSARYKQAVNDTDEDNSKLCLITLK